MEVLRLRSVEKEENEEIYPADPRPRTVDASCVVEIKVADPKPWTVEFMVVLRKGVDIRPNKLGVDTNPAV